MHEEWRAVPGYEGVYEVSDVGRVRSLDRFVPTAAGPRYYAGRMLRPPLSNGYPTARLCHGGRHTQTAVHRLIAAIFLGPRPDGAAVNHINGVKIDNRLANLEYVTPAQNGMHAWRTGLCDHLRGESHYRAVLSNAMVVEAQLRVAKGESISGVAAGFGVKAGTLGQGLRATWLTKHNAGEPPRGGESWVRQRRRPPEGGLGPVRLEVRHDLPTR